MTQRERDARLVLQGVLLTIAALLAVGLSGALLALGRGAPPISSWPVGLVALALLGTVVGARRWVVPEQRKALRSSLAALAALLVLSGAGALLVWWVR